jgi:fructokinase
VEVSVSPTDRPLVGIDLGGTKIEGVVLAPDGRVLRRLRLPTPREYDGTLAELRELVDRLEEGFGDRLAVGVGTPGTVSPATGLMKNANSVWLNDRPLADDLERALERPLRLANDADCFALSEATDGGGRDARIVFGVILGTGVGGGVVVDGRPVSGPNAIGGEWGHNPLPWRDDAERPGADCYCGLTGCIETFLSGPGLSRDHHEATSARLAPAEIAARAEEGDVTAEATLQRYENRLARALAGVINILDPHAVVLGGGLSNLTRLYRRVPELWSRWVFSDRVDTRLVPPVHGDSSGVRGAAWLWKEDGS